MAKLVAVYEYTDAELLALYREAWAMCSQGKSYTIRGKMLTRQDLPDILKTIETLESRVSSTGGRPSHTYIRRVRG